MQEPYETDVRFKLNAEAEAKVGIASTVENDERHLANAADELRLEKINQRITFITILLPVLIVIVLALAYFDIKNRLARSEDADLMEFRKISVDLDSRFSSLSLRQAALEESIAKAVQDQAQTASEITPLSKQLTSLEATLNQLQKNTATLVSQKEFQTARENLLKQINETSQNVTRLAATVDKADKEIEAMTSTVKSEIAKMAAAFNGRDAQIDQLQARVNQQIERLNKLERSTTQLDNTKITKAELDLALRLESLKTEQSIKTHMESLQSALRALESRIGRQSSSHSTSSGSSIATPATPKVSPAPASTLPQKRGGIEEQTIGR